LAYQIKKEFARFTKYIPNLVTECFYGGVPKSDHVKVLKGSKPPHVVIGTPGRVWQLVKEKYLNLSTLSIFVLDECDKMLCESDEISSSTNFHGLQFSEQISNDVLCNHG
jgi:ATP-dependent RNA helicase UAP56/SUB2